MVMAVVSKGGKTSRRAEGEKAGRSRGERGMDGGRGLSYPQSYTQSFRCRDSQWGALRATHKSFTVSRV